MAPVSKFKNLVASAFQKSLEKLQLKKFKIKTCLAFSGVVQCLATPTVRGAGIQWYPDRDFLSFYNSIRTLYFFLCPSFVHLPLQSIYLSPTLSAYFFLSISISLLLSVPVSPFISLLR